MLQYGVIAVVPDTIFLRFDGSYVFIGRFSGLRVYLASNDLEFRTIADALFLADLRGIAGYFALLVCKYFEYGGLDFEVLVLFGKRDDILIHRTGADGTY